MHFSFKVNVNLTCLIFVCLFKSFESLLNNNKFNFHTYNTKLVFHLKKWSHISKIRLKANANNNGVQFNREMMKLPIIQIHKLQSADTSDNLPSVYYSLESEFFCGQDVDFSLRKAFFVLKSFLSACSISSPSSISNQYISNIYSDEQIESVLPSSVISSSQSLLSLPSYVVLYISRTGCQQCTKAEPVYASLPSQLITAAAAIAEDAVYDTFSKISSTAASASNNFSFEFYQTNVDYIPLYMSTLRKRLSGVKQPMPSSSSAVTQQSESQELLATDDSEDKIIDEQESPYPPCTVCSNTGFIKCTECLGKGYIKRIAAEGGDNSNDITLLKGVNAAAAVKSGVAVYCPSCAGYKNIRCPACGGRCIQCTI